jgi:vitamin B12 transporter
MKKKLNTVLALFIAAPPVLALAGQETGTPAPEIVMDEVVVTATRSEENIKNIPAKVEVIDSQAIEMTVAETVTEQLKKNSSINVIEYPGALAGIGIRGFRPEFSGITKHSLVLINGRPAGATNLATILSDNIERIEVLKGPASSLYGGEAMGGVVNIITKKNTEELTGTVELGLGSFSTNFQKAAIGGGIGEQFDFDVTARRYDQNDNFKMGNGETRAHTSYRTQNGTMRFGGDIGETWRVDLSGDLYQGRDIETPGDTFAGDDKSGHKDIDRYGVDFTAGGELGTNNQFSVTAYKTNETSETYKHYTGWSTISQVPPYQSYDSEIDWLGFQIKDEYTWDVHRFIGGIDYQDISKESRSYNLDGSRKAPYSPDEGRENIAAYLETIWNFMDERLTATVGGRYDTFDVETKSTPFKTNFTPNSENFSTFSPRAGINYLFDQGIRLHSTIGQAFVPPNAAQLAGYSETYVGGATMITKGNANLDPETSLTYDFGAGYDLAKWGLALDITYFHTNVDDKISKVTRGNIGTYENSLSAEMDGLETTLSFDIGAPLDWDRSLSFFVNSTNMFKAEEEQSNGEMKDIYNVADYTINYGIQYDDGMFDGKLHCRSQGRMKDTDWNAAGYPEIEYPSFTVVDLMLGARFLDHHRVIVKADNLVDKDYYEKKGFPKPGRSFFVSYRYEF